MGNAGWIAALIFCACAAIRLARFNVESVRDEGATKGNPYFTGLPTPAAACMMLLPLLISFQWDGPLVREPWVSGIFIAVTSVLMVSRIPTPSIKYMKLQRQHRALAVIGLRHPGRASDRLALGDADHRPVDLCRVNSVRDRRAPSALRRQTGILARNANAHARHAGVSARTARLGKPKLKIYLEPDPELAGASPPIDRFWNGRAMLGFCWKLSPSCCRSAHSGCCRLRQQHLAVTAATATAFAIIADAAGQAALVNHQTFRLDIAGRRVIGHGHRRRPRQVGIIGHHPPDAMPCAPISRRRGAIAVIAAFGIAWRIAVVSARGTAPRHGAAWPCGHPGSCTGRQPWPDRREPARSSDRWWK